MQCMCGWCVSLCDLVPVPVVMLLATPPPGSQVESRENRQKQSRGRNRVRIEIYGGSKRTGVHSEINERDRDLLRERDRRGK